MNFSEFSDVQPHLKWVESYLVFVISSTHHGDVHGVFVTVRYHIYSPWWCAWSVCQCHCTLLHLLTMVMCMECLSCHCTLLHLLTMVTCMECLSASLYTITSTHHGNVHGVFVGVTVHYYIYSPWQRVWSVCRRHCTLLHLLTMAMCMECLSASLYTITSTHHGDVHGVFVGVTVHYYIYSPWQRVWSVCRRHCTLLHLLTMVTCMECLSASLYTITSTHHGDMHGVFVSVTVHYYIYSPWWHAWSVCRCHCKLLHLLTMVICMECLYIYSPWRRAWTVCQRHCTLLHLLTMATCMECLSASLYTITSTHHGDVHGVFVHLLTMATCMDCLSASLYTITSTHHGDVHGVFVGVTVHYYIYSPWRCAWSVCRRHCTLLHLLTMATCMECLSASLYTATVWMPIFRAVRMIRHAISPRFAIRIFSIGWTAANITHLFYRHFNWSNNSWEEFIEVDFDGHRTARSRVDQIILILIFFFGRGGQWSSHPKYPEAASVVAYTLVLFSFINILSAFFSGSAIPTTEKKEFTGCLWRFQNDTNYYCCYRSRSGNLHEVASVYKETTRYLILRLSPQLFAGSWETPCECRLESSLIGTLTKESTGYNNLCFPIEQLFTFQNWTLLYLRWTGFWQRKTSSILMLGVNACKM